MARQFEDSINRNIEGYHDPVLGAILAIEDAESVKETRDRAPLYLDETDYTKCRLVKAIRAVTDLAGFDILNRVELRDRRTGKIYR